jgi:hypothetical protein
VVQLDHDTNQEQYFEADPSTCGISARVQSISLALQVDCNLNRQQSFSAHFLVLQRRLLNI